MYETWAGGLWYIPGLCFYMTSVFIWHCCYGTGTWSNTAVISSESKSSVYSEDLRHQFQSKSKSEKKVCLCSLLLFFLPPQSHLQAKALHSCPIIYPQNALWGIRTKGKKKAWMYGIWTDLSCCFSCSLLSVSKAFSMC